MEALPPAHPATKKGPRIQSAVRETAVPGP
jgi:hypothetical protein